MTPSNLGSLDPEIEKELAEKSGPSLIEGWRVLVQRRSVVLSCLCIVLLLAAALTFFSAPTFRATTTLQIDRQAPEILSFKDVMGVEAPYVSFQDFYQTQYRILQSRAVTRMAVERLDLVHRPEFASRPASPLQRFQGWVKQRLFGIADDGDRWEPALAFVQDGLSIGPIRNSQLVRVSYEDRNPQLARDIANAVAEAYLRFNFESRYGTTEAAAEFLTKEVARVQTDIEKLERQLQEDSSKKELLALNDGVQDISQQALAALNSNYVEARGRLALNAARFESTREGTASAMPEVLHSPLIMSLKQKHAELERQYGQMAERFKEDWPALAQVREELALSRERLEAETQATAQQVRRMAEAEFHRAEAEVQNLQAQLELQKGEVKRINRDAIELATVKSAIATRRQVLADLVARQSETETSDRLRHTETSNIRIVDPAEIPKEPVKPNKKVNLLLGLVLGCGLGVAMAFLIEHLDQTIKSEQDIQRIGNLTVLGHLPLIQALSAEGDSAGTPLSFPTDIASHQDLKSHFAEACRNLRTSLLLASPERPPRNIVITSCQPSEGKSTVAVNLAIVLTQLGRRVLLLDGDLRRPRLHKVFRVDNAVGLSSFLSGNVGPENLAVETMVPNLSIISSGPIPPNPSELLDSAALQYLLAGLQRDEAFDHVIIDSPPMLQVTDAVILATRADVTIIVVRQGKTSRESLALGSRRLRLSRARIAGAVLNAVSEESGYYYYGGYKGYRYDAASSQAPEPGKLAGSFKNLRRRQDRRAKSA